MNDRATLTTRTAAWLGLLLGACGGSADRLPQDPEAPPGARVVPEPFTAEEVTRLLRLSPLGPPPPDPTNRFADDPRAAALGRALFFERGLSKDGTQACATCHPPAGALADGRTVGVGVTTLERHVPALWNLAWQRWLFWDGRADSLWAQALAVIESPLEMAGTRLAALHRVHDDPRLRRLYEEAFGPLPDLDDETRFPPTGRPVPPDDPALLSAAQHAAEHAHHGADAGGSGSDFYHPHQRAWDGMSQDDRGAVDAAFVNLGKALAAHERRLVSDDAPFDRFVRGLRTGDPGDLAALDPAARRGARLFLGEANCHLCHSGPLFSDREFHALPLPAGDGPAEDPGRAEGLRKLLASEFHGRSVWSDDPEAGGVKLDHLPAHLHGRGEFRTPSLRNVARTAPYMHQGQLPDLAAVVDFYSELDALSAGSTPTERVLRPLNLDAGQKADLVAFLQALTDADLDPTLGAPADER